MFIKVASSSRLSGIGMPSPILWSHLLKMQRIVLLSSLLWWEVGIKASLTFKCMTEHLFAGFSYSIAVDTYLWKQMMQMNRKLIHIWYNVDKKHLLFTKRKCHKFSWLFMASRCSPRKRSICACRIACKVLVSIVLYSLSFVFLKKGLPSWKTVFVKRDRWRSPYFRVWFSKKESFFLRKLKLND